MINTILIVDDSPIARKILRKCLPTDRAYECHEAENGIVGVQKFRQIRPDVTFMDLTMPEMDGLQALQEITKIEENAVVIVATADVQIKTIFKVMDLGALMVLKKPMSKDLVEGALHEAEEVLQGVR